MDAIDQIKSLGTGIAERMRAPAEPKTQGERLDKAIDDAQVLLKFGIESHKKVNQKVIDELVYSIGDLRWPDRARVADPVSRERNFWSAYETLSELVAPVTAESIMQSRQQAQKMVGVTLPYAVSALLLFFAVALFQWRWFDGTTLRLSLKENEAKIAELSVQERKQSREFATNTSKLQQLEQDTDEVCPDYFIAPGSANAKSKQENQAQMDHCKRLKSELGDARQRNDSASFDLEQTRSLLERIRGFRAPRVALLDDWMDLWNFAGGDTVPTIDGLATMKTRLANLKTETDRLQLDVNLGNNSERRVVLDIQEVQNRRDAMSSYESWRRARETARTTLAAKRVQYNDLQREIDREVDNQVERLKHRVNQRVDLLEKYVFPILLGALGSLIFILRSLISAIKENVFTSHFLSLSIVRISLGTIAGLLGTLVLPGEAMPARDFLPLALPLLFGYAVEIFFTAMDRLVGAFSGPRK